MKFFIIIASTIISVLQANKVIELNSDNFDSVVDGTRNVFVKFEASWCGPCKALAPILDQVAKSAFPDLDGDTIIAKIDADEEEEISNRFDIQFFPTLKLFLKGRPHDQHVDYDLRVSTNGRTASAISQFIKNNVSANIKSLPQISSIKPTVALSQILSSLKSNKSQNVNQYGQLIGARSDFVSGGFEKSTRPYHKLHKSGKSDKKAKKLPAKRNINAKNADPIPDLDAQTAIDIISKAGSTPVILVFYSPNCPHCHQFLPVAMKYAVMNQNKAIFIRVNGDANIAFRDSFKLTHYPSVVGFYANQKGQKWEKLNSDPSYDAMNHFISKLSK